MKKKNITITVSGETSSGKSRLIYFLKEFLSKNGFYIEFDGGLDFKNEYQFDMFMKNNIDLVIDSIKTTRSIKFEEKYSKRLNNIENKLKLRKLRKKKLINIIK